MKLTSFTGALTLTPRLSLMQIEKVRRLGIKAAKELVVRLPRFDGQALSPEKRLNDDDVEGSHATPRQYKEAFKREAVRLSQSSGQ